MLLFPDANFFLQFRDPAELPWCELLGDVEEICLLVCRTVQSEIDGFKGDGRDRRADRARKASSRFRDIIVDRAPLVLRERGPRVTLDLAPRVRPGYPHPATLDLSVKDDRIVAEAMAQAAETGETGETVALLTADTGPMLTARDHGFAFFSLPDLWRLPKETDDRDRRITELTRQVAELKRAAPELVVSAATEEGPLLGPLTVTLVEHTALTPDAIDCLVERLRVRYPMTTDFSERANPRPRSSLLSFIVASGMSGLGTWTPPSEASIASYQEEAYPGWLERVRIFLRDLHLHVSPLNGQAAISLSMENIGTVPAESLLVEIEALGGLLLSESEVNTERAPLSLPEPPEPPTWKMVDHSSRLAEIMGTMAQAQAAGVSLPFPLPGLHRPADDPNAFYWRDRHLEGPTTRWRFQCREFRHGSSPEIFNVVLVAPFALAANSGAIRFTASARNLPRQLEQVVTVRVERRWGDTDAKVEALMPLDG